MPGFIDELDKAELHVHLEGSASFDTLRELATGFSDAEIRSACAFADFQGFIQAYKWVAQLLRHPEDYALLTRRLLGQLASQQVRYVEINLSVGVMLRMGQDPAQVFAAVSQEAAKSAIRVAWIFDAVRQFGADAAMRVAELAAERAGDGVVAFGMGGDESREEAASFAPVFAFASRRGLHLTPHAGETTNAQSVWDALSLGAERLGHGIRAVEDPELMRHLRDANVPLEICITSNVLTGAVPSLEAHPIRRLFDAGVPIVLNTDDPGLFDTTLTREYEIAASRFGFSEAELRQIAENGFRYGFGRGYSKPQ